jgi:glutathione synthase/RimK-type ligase-like ATP-grasp enzyme
MAHLIGLLVGRERSFPDALIAEVGRRGRDVSACYAKVDAVRHDRPLPYDVLVDRISHDVPCYQPVLKHAALNGTRVVNNPFWRIADDKFFNVALADRLGIRVPRTYVLPQHSYGDDVSTESLTNLVYPIDWEGLCNDLRFPLYLKPHQGGGWRGVHRVHNLPELLSVYDRTGTQTLLAQEEIAWVQYVRCIVVGQEEVLPALWDPRRSHLERYSRAAESMPALKKELEKRLVEDSRALCRALGYDMNTVEWAVREDGTPFAIDFMNSAPDLDVTSLGEEHFRWAVKKMADLLVGLAKDSTRVPKHHWLKALGG